MYEAIVGVKGDEKFILSHDFPGRLDLRKLTGSIPAGPGIFICYIKEKLDGALMIDQYIKKMNIR